MRLSYCEIFRVLFPDDKACFRYLHHLKDEQPFACLRCGHPYYSKGRTRYHRRCKSCGYDESPLAGTLLCGVRLPVRKAFYLLYKLRTQQRQASAAQLATLFGLHPRTVLRFQKRFAAVRQPVVSPEEALCSLREWLLPGKRQQDGE